MNYFLLSLHVLKKKKQFRGSLSFDRAELGAEVHIGASGVPLSFSSKTDYDEFKKKCGGDVTAESFSWIYNDPKFFKDVSKSDVLPRPEDFMVVPFRLLSATIVGAGSWKATDFSNSDVLRESMPMLNNKPVFKEHNFDLDNWVGFVQGTTWAPASDATKNGLTIPVPPGINGMIAIDIKTNPKLARGVATGVINSNSVTVVFDFEMSHDFSSEDEYFSQIGMVADDGKMVTRKVTRIREYYETSLVFLGADPFAKAFKEDGGLNDIDISNVRQEFMLKYPSFDGVDDKEKNRKNYRIGFELTDGIISLSRNSAKQLEKPTEKPQKMKELIIAFIASFGQHFNLKAGDEPTEAQMIEHMKKLSFEKDDDKAKTAELVAAGELFFTKAKETGGDSVKAITTVDALLEKVTFIKADDAKKLENIASLEANAKIGQDFLNLKREEGKRLYKLAAGSDKKDSVISMFDKATSDELDGLISLHTKSATAKFVPTCQKCQSHDVTFQSSFTGESPEEEDDNDYVLETDTMTGAYIRNEFAKAAKSAQASKTD